MFSSSCILNELSSWLDTVEETKLLNHNVSIEVTGWFPTSWGSQLNEIIHPSAKEKNFNFETQVTHKMRKTCASERC